MEIVIYPGGIVDVLHPGQGVGDIAKAGFADAALDLSLYCDSDVLEEKGKEGQKQQKRTKAADNPKELGACLKPLLDKCMDAGVGHLLAVAPYLRRNTQREDLNGFLGQLAEESIRICGQTGCKYVVVRPLHAGIEKDRLWDVNRKFYLSLAVTAEEQGVTILLENGCQSVNGHLVRGICSDGRTAAEWVDKLNEEAGSARFGFCMDVGVCNLCGQNMYDFILGLGDRLKAVVLRDCDGSRENAMLPFTCVSKGTSQTDWLNFIRGLRETGFDGVLALNLKDTAAAFSPILRPGLVSMAKSVADYFKWQIELEGLLPQYPSRVLFGAGNMCRNYMKCYGEKYPPLFTCDNNSKLWGTEFCGLEVKSPEALKELPPDCAIFICNVYYREIERQLRGMGLKNPVEFFNDEYMPAFHFDRLNEGGER